MRRFRKPVNRKVTGVRISPSPLRFWPRNVAVETIPSISCPKTAAFDRRWVGFRMPLPRVVGDGALPHLWPMLFQKCLAGRLIMHFCTGSSVSAQMANWAASKFLFVDVTRGDLVAQKTVQPKTRSDSALEMLKCWPNATLPVIWTTTDRWRTASPMHNHSHEPRFRYFRPILQVRHATGRDRFGWREPSAGP